MSKYTVMVSYWGQRMQDHLVCMREVEASGVPIITCDERPHIDMCRAYLVSLALEKTDSDILVFIDHDIIFTLKDLEGLVNSLRTSSYDVLGGLYSYRKAGVGRLVGRLTNPPKTLDFYVPGTWDADWLGMGFTAIRRSVFKKLDESLPLVLCTPMSYQLRPYFSHIIDETGYHGEDVSFCYRVAAAGLRIGIDTQPRLFHRGMYNYGLEDAGLSISRGKTLTINFKTDDSQ